MEGTRPTSAMQPYVNFGIVVLHRLLTSTYAPQKIRSGGVLVLSRICIKSHRNTQSREAETIKFIAANTQIPVPRIYETFVYKGRLYIVMQRLRGKPAFTDWTAKSEETKNKICNQLRDFVRQMREVKRAPHESSVSNVVGGPIYDQRLPKRSFWGPFDSIQAFHRELRNGVELPLVGKDSETSSDFLELTELIQFHEGIWSQPVLTHGDLSSFNIMLYEDEVTGIIDWETAGWLPPYWEYTSARMVNPRNQFWCQEVDKFLHVDTKAMKMERCRRRYFGDF